MMTMKYRAWLCAGALLTTQCVFPDLQQGNGYGEDDDSGGSGGVNRASGGNGASNGDGGASGGALSVGGCSNTGGSDAGIGGLLVAPDDRDGDGVPDDDDECPSYDDRLLRVSPSDLNLSCQLEVEASLGITTIDGDLFIGGAGDILSIESLRCLTSVKGDLTVMAGDSLDSLVGLSSLASVEGDVTIHPGPGMADLHGLEGLQSVTSFIVEGNEGLTSLFGLTLSEVGGDLVLTEQQVLDDISALNSLNSIGGSLVLYNDDSLDSLVALSSLTDIGWNLHIEGSTGITNLDALSGLGFIGGSVILRETELESIGNLSAITDVALLHIQGNNELTDLGGLFGIENVRNDFYIGSNAKLATCLAEQLRNNIGGGNIDGTVTIEFNDDTGVCP